MTKLIINGKEHEVNAENGMPLLWAIREQCGLTGTKFGCGIAQCGACTVHLDGQPIRSCITPAASVEGKNITTIEGIATDPNDQTIASRYTIQNNRGSRTCICRI
jgi:isoquinoline 1-oxidoreductase alpha subunit